MKKNIEFPNLRADQIECRVGSVSKEGKGFSLLLYKTARVDANILDEVVGQYNWQKKFYSLKNNIYCSLGIYDEERKEWIWKDDCGAESETEAEKGEASDSFKRAGFAWGIGRELYTSPFIWISGDKYTKFDRFSVSSITITDKVIVALTIVNDKSGEVVFTYPRTSYKKVTPEEPKKAVLSDETQKLVKEYDVNLVSLAIYIKKDLNELTNEDVRKAVEQKKERLAKMGK